MNRRLFILALLALGLTSPAFAGSGWHKIDTRQAGGEAKEIEVQRAVEKVLVRVTKDSVIINTIVVREGAKKTPKPIGARLNQGEQREIDLGGKRTITGLRISDDGKGTYDIYVR